MDEIIRANESPLSVVFVGIGDNDFSTLIELDGDKKELISSDRVWSKWDLVQFVNYEKFKSDYATLAKETLSEIPNQFIQYMDMKNLKPLDYNEPANQGKFWDLEKLRWEKAKLGK